MAVLFVDLGGTTQKIHAGAPRGRPSPAPAVGASCLELHDPCALVHGPALVPSGVVLGHGHRLITVARTAAPRRRGDRRRMPGISGRFGPDLQPAPAALGRTRTCSLLIRSDQGLVLERVQRSVCAQVVLIRGLRGPASTLTCRAVLPGPSAVVSAAAPGSGGFRVDAPQADSGHRVQERAPRLVRPGGTGSARPSWALAIRTAPYSSHSTLATSSSCRTLQISASVCTRRPPVRSKVGTEELLSNACRPVLLWQGRDDVWIQGRSEDQRDLLGVAILTRRPATAVEVLEPGLVRRAVPIPGRARHVCRRPGCAHIRPTLF